jgi:hypothetical protein
MAGQKHPKGNQNLSFSNPKVNILARFVVLVGGNMILIEPIPMTEHVIDRNLPSWNECSSIRCCFGALVSILFELLGSLRRQNGHGTAIVMSVLYSIYSLNSLEEVRTCPRGTLAFTFLWRHRILQDYTSQTSL